MTTVRGLPDGRCQSARISGQQENRLEIDSVEGVWNGFDLGTPVEIETASTIYLGEVVNRCPDSLLGVVVEHTIDRARLAEIENIWKTAE